MRRSRTIRLAAPCAAALLAACGGAQSALQPDGPDARATATLYWVLLAIAAVVCVVVIGLLVVALLRRRDFRGEAPPLPISPSTAPRGSDPDNPTESDDAPLPVMLRTGEQDRRTLRWLAIGAVAIPAVILVATYLFTLRTIDLTHPDDPGSLTVEVTGWQWWWEAAYYDAQGRRLFETANEIHIPAGRRVRFRLRSGDVIHSFWVPRLGGKMDMIPGRTNELSLRADWPGEYRGQCAEYCAGPHAMMSFLVIAQPEAEFQRWAALQARDAAAPTEAQTLAGQRVFFGRACVACHAVRGTPAVSNLGPDLTHVASRRTLAAVTIPNTAGHLGGWIQNPQKVKPAVHMPAVPMDSEEFLALLSYLQTLR